MRISDWSSDVCLPIWRLRCLDPKVAGSYCPASRAPLPPKYFLGVTVNQAWGQIATELYCVAKKHHRAAATIAAPSASSITRIPRSAAFLSFNPAPGPGTEGHQYDIRPTILIR